MVKAASLRRGRGDHVAAGAVDSLMKLRGSSGLRYGAGLRGGAGSRGGVEIRGGGGLRCGTTGRGPRMCECERAAQDGEGFRGNLNSGSPPSSRVGGGDGSNCRIGMRGGSGCRAGGGGAGVREWRRFSASVFLIATSSAESSRSMADSLSAGARLRSCATMAARARS